MTAPDRVGTAILSMKSKAPGVGRLVAGLMWLFALFAPARLSGDTTLRFDFTPRLDVREELLDSLAAGHRAEIHYEVRVYRRSTGLGRLFGDRLIAESTVLYEARWDELNDLFVVLVDEERELAFANADLLIAFLLALVDHRIEVIDPDDREIYLLCRAQVEPIRLVPPLTLLTFLMPRFRTTTSWTRTPFVRIEP